MKNVIIISQKIDMICEWSYLIESNCIFASSTKHNNKYDDIDELEGINQEASSGGKRVAGGSENRMSREFPNVGSSPVMHEHETVSGVAAAATNNLIESSSEEEEEDDVTGRDRTSASLGKPHDGGIVMINGESRESRSEENSLSDNEDLLIDEDDEEEEEEEEQEEEEVEEEEEEEEATAELEGEEEEEHEEQEEEEAIEECDEEEEAADERELQEEAKIAGEEAETDQDQDSTLNTINDSQEETVNSSPSNTHSTIGNYFQNYKRIIS